MACNTADVVKEIKNLTGLNIGKNDGYTRSLEEMIKIGQTYSNERKTYEQSAAVSGSPKLQETEDDKLSTIQAAIKSRKNIHSNTKEFQKSLIANKFIGEGSTGSSTGFYQEQYEAQNLANLEEYTEDDVVFVSVNGGRNNAISAFDEKGNLQGVYKNIDKAMNANATIILDTFTTAKGYFNKDGEGKLYDYMNKDGNRYQYEKIHDVDWTYKNKKSENVDYGYGKWSPINREDIEHNAELDILQGLEEQGSLDKLKEAEKAKQDKEKTAKKQILNKGDKVFIKGKKNYGEHEIVKIFKDRKTKTVKFKIKNKNGKTFIHIRKSLVPKTIKKETPKQIIKPKKEPVIYKNVFEPNDLVSLVTKNRTVNYRVTEVIKEGKDKGKIILYNISDGIQTVIKRNPDLYTKTEVAVEAESPAKVEITAKKVSTAGEQESFASNNDIKLLLRYFNNMEKKYSPTEIINAMFTTDRELLKKAKDITQRLTIEEYNKLQKVTNYLELDGNLNDVDDIPFQREGAGLDTEFDEGLNKKLQNILKKLFPNISLDYLVIGDGIKGQANIQAKTVLINSLLQSQDTLPHEYAHHYIAMFREAPIVQEAIKKWGTEEKLVQAIGEQSVAQEGEAYGWWNEFTQWIKDSFNKISKKDKEELKNLLTDAFLTNRDLFNRNILDAKNKTLLVKLDKPNAGNQKVDGFTAKAEYHITALGFPQGKQLKKIFEAKPEMEAKVQDLIDKSDFSYNESKDVYKIQRDMETWVDWKDHSKGKKTNHDEAIIVKVEAPGIKKFINELNDMLGTDFPVPYPHISIATKGSPMGIGIANEESFNKLKPKALNIIKAEAFKSNSKEDIILSKNTEDLIEEVNNLKEC